MAVDTDMAVGEKVLTGATAVGVVSSRAGQQKGPDGVPGMAVAAHVAVGEKVLPGDA
jgi:hypothetical protein